MTVLRPNVSALPQQYITIGAGIGGAIKRRPSDFRVEEIPLYECSGDGEHLYLCVEKTGVAHVELLATLRKYFNVPDVAIGYAGMKDKIGVTRQMVSIHLPGREVSEVNLPHERIRILSMARHRNKLRRGHLSGNRFHVRIREVSSGAAAQARTIMAQLERTGVPAYFGAQRFGYRGNNHVLGALLLKGAWREFISELVGAQGAPFPEYQRERRELADESRYEEAQRLWAAPDRAERRVLQALSRRCSPGQACRSLDEGTRFFLISAFQSAIFNRVLDQRIADDTFSTLRPGDLAWKHSSRRVFHVSDEELKSGDFKRRLAEFELSPSGPLWGRDMPAAQEDIGRLERDAFDAMGLEYEAFISARHAPTGERRPLRAPLSEVEVSEGADEHGEYINASFQLPRGTYATVVLREVMKNDESREAAGSDQDGDDQS